MLDCIEAFHRHGYVHRDIKASNFALSRPDKSSRPQRYHIIDFGLSRQHLDEKRKVIPARSSAEFRGTSMYASLSSHRRQELGPKDDLWSWFFLVMDFMRGELPWAADAQLKNRAIVLGLKEYYTEKSPEMLVEGLQGGAHLLEIMKHLQGLNYEDMPDYKRIASLLRRVASDPPIDSESDGQRADQQQQEPQDSPEDVSNASELAARCEETKSDSDRALLWAGKAQEALDSAAPKAVIDLVLEVRVVLVVLELVDWSNTSMHASRNIQIATKYDTFFCVPDLDPAERLRVQQVVFKLEQSQRDAISVVAPPVIQSFVKRRQSEQKSRSDALRRRRERDMQVRRTLEKQSAFRAFANAPQQAESPTDNASTGTPPMELAKQNAASGKGPVRSDSSMEMSEGEATPAQSGTAPSNAPSQAQATASAPAIPPPSAPAARPPLPPAFMRPGGVPPRPPPPPGPAFRVNGGPVPPMPPPPRHLFGQLMRGQPPPIQGAQLAVGIPGVSAPPLVPPLVPPQGGRGRSDSNGSDQNGTPSSTRQFPRGPPPHILQQVRRGRSDSNGSDRSREYSRVDRRDRDEHDTRRSFGRNGREESSHSRYQDEQERGTPSGDKISYPDKRSYREIQGSYEERPRHADRSREDDREGSYDDRHRSDRSRGDDRDHQSERPNDDRGYQSSRSREDKRGYDGERPRPDERNYHEKRRYKEDREEEDGRGYRESRKYPAERDYEREERGYDQDERGYEREPGYDDEPRYQKERKYIEERSDEVERRYEDKQSRYDERARDDGGSYYAKRSQRSYPDERSEHGKRSTTDERTYYDEQQEEQERYSQREYVDRSEYENRGRYDDRSQRSEERSRNDKRKRSRTRSVSSDRGRSSRRHHHSRSASSGSRSRSRSGSRSPTHHRSSSRHGRRSSRDYRGSPHSRHRSRSSSRSRSASSSRSSQHHYGSKRRDHRSGAPPRRESRR